MFLLPGGSKSADAASFKSLNQRLVVCSRERTTDESKWKEVGRHGECCCRAKRE